MPDILKCMRCNQLKPFAEFPQNSRRTLKDHRPHCKECRRDLYRLFKYGLTLDEYIELLERHGGKCACCGESPPRLDVDHDHVTGKIRGMLCRRCNVGLGYYELYKDLYEEYLDGLA